MTCAPQGLSDLDVATFCSKCVDPMGEESDHVQLVALTDALKASRPAGVRGGLRCRGGEAARWAAWWRVSPRAAS